MSARRAFPSSDGTSPAALTVTRSWFPPATIVLGLGATATRRGSAPAASTRSGYCHLDHAPAPGETGWHFSGLLVLNNHHLPRVPRHASGCHSGAWRSLV